MNQKQEPILVSDEEKIVELLIENIDSLEDKILEYKNSIGELAASDSRDSMNFYIHFNQKKIKFEFEKFTLSKGSAIYFLKYFVLDLLDQRRKYGAIIGSDKEIGISIDNFIKELKAFPEKKKLEKALNNLNKKQTLSWNEINSEIEGCCKVGEEYWKVESEIFTIYNARSYPRGLSVKKDKSVKDTRKEYTENSRINSYTVKYLLGRLNQTNTHPVLKLFYAYNILGIHENAKKLVKEKIDIFEISKTYIHSMKEVIEKGLYTKEKFYEMELAILLINSMTAARNLGNKKLVEDVKNLLFSFLKNHCQKIESVGVWRLILEEIIDLKDARIGELDDDEEKTLLQDMKERLTKASKKPKGFPFQKICKCLIEFYKKENKFDEVKEYAKIYREGLEEMRYGVVEELETLRREAYQPYFSKNKELMKEVNDQIEKMREIESKEIKGARIKRTIDYGIKKEHVDSVVKRIVSSNNLDEVFLNFSKEFILKKDLIKKSFSQTPSISMFPFIKQGVANEEGVVSKKIDSEEDSDDHLFIHCDFFLDLFSLFIRESIESIIDKFDLDENKLTEYFFQSCIFEKERRFIFKECFKNYLNYSKKFEKLRKKEIQESDLKHEIHFIPTIVPEIERLIRRLLKERDVRMYKKNSEGGFDLKGLGSLLEKEFPKDGLGPELSFYFRSVLTVKGSWNLRNNLAHGLLHPIAQTNIKVFDRVFHLLICIRSLLT